MSSKKLYVSAMARGATFLKRRVEACPVCQKSAVLWGERPGGVKLWVHSVTVNRTGNIVESWGCETRIDRLPAVVLPREVMAAQRRG